MAGVIFSIFTVFAGYASLVLVALPLTAGLYMLAELAEEYPSAAGKAIKYIILGNVCIHLLLLIDGLPLIPSVVGLLSQASYYFMLTKFPFIQVFSLRPCCPS
jgi:hypothetical protein